MGRWSQQRRRGGGPTGAAAVVLPKITSILWDAGQGLFVCTFSQPITYDGSGSLDGVTVNGETVDTCAAVDATTLNLQFPTAFGAGDPWLNDAQPTQITETLQIPQSGAT